MMLLAESYKLKRSLLNKLIKHSLHLNQLLGRQSGFTLIEVMTVVAIIGVLTTLSVPSISKYSAKTRQAEAKTQLSSLFAAEKSFYAEFGAFHSMFGAIGYAPQGRMRYNVGFNAVGTPANAADGFTSTYTAPADATNSVLFCNNNAGAGGGYGGGGSGGSGPVDVGCTVLVGVDGLPPPNDPGGAAVVTNLTKNTFLAGAAGMIFNFQLDVWSIDQEKNVSHSQEGISP